MAKDNKVLEKTTHSGYSGIKNYVDFNNYSFFFFNIACVCFKDLKIIDFLFILPCDV